MAETLDCCEHFHLTRRSQDGHIYFFCDACESPFVDPTRPQPKQDWRGVDASAKGAPPAIVPHGEREWGC